MWNSGIGIWEGEAMETINFLRKMRNKSEPRPFRSEGEGYFCEREGTRRLQPFSDKSSSCIYTEPIGTGPNSLRRQFKKMILPTQTLDNRAWDLVKHVFWLEICDFFVFFWLYFLAFDHPGSDFLLELLPTQCMNPRASESSTERKSRVEKIGSKVSIFATECRPSMFNRMLKSIRSTLSTIEFSLKVSIQVHIWRVENNTRKRIDDELSHKIFLRERDLSFTTREGWTRNSIR